MDSLCAYVLVHGLLGGMALSGMAPRDEHMNRKVSLNMYLNRILCLNRFSDRIMCTESAFEPHSVSESTSEPHSASESTCRRDMTEGMGRGTRPRMRRCETGYRCGMRRWLELPDGGQNS